MPKQNARGHDARPAVCYYVSGHGLGHASRATLVMRSIPQDIRLIVKSSASEDYIRREAKRPLDFHADRFDFGAWQKSNFEIDWKKTFSVCKRIGADAARRIDDEARFLEANNVGAVVSDIPPVPHCAARLAGIPGIAIVNFTWIEIFRKAADAAGIAAARLLDQYKKQYSSASLALRTPFCFPMKYFPVFRDIPLIGRRGIASRERLIREGVVAEGQRLVLLYFGNWGNGGMRLDRLERLRDVMFVSLSEMPPPVRYLDPSIWDFADVLASSDAVLAKPGYGAMAGCMAAGIPVIYYPRPEFAEYRVMRRDLDHWGGAVRIGRRNFLSCRWECALEKAFTLSPVRVDADGAHEAATVILRSML
ncbi:MAG: hypothetical protein NTY46_01865 [Candidatus Sumerlaeota bacterium]|nr:hypothetical protein [Candidatus Sumerlaeota bacterium]